MLITSIFTFAHVFERFHFEDHKSLGLSEGQVLLQKISDFLLVFTFRPEINFQQIAYDNLVRYDIKFSHGNCNIREIALEGFFFILSKYVQKLS